MPIPGALRAGYESVKAESRQAAGSDAAADAIRGLITKSLRFLAVECDETPLVSLVDGKGYIAFTNGGVNSRPVNTDLFVADADAIADRWSRWTRGDLSSGDRTRLFYTAGLAPGLVMEVFNRQNRKGPATYFESFVGYLAASSLGVSPERRATLDLAGRAIPMTMDYIFRPPAGPRVHLAVKMSTRERVVQAWAHQRLLEAAYGRNVYRGILVAFAETKMDSRSREVVEICVPDQWLAYQAFLARMDAVYYFDPPNRYLQLAREHPRLMNLRPIGEFSL